MSYPHHGLVHPALYVLAELGKMLPRGWYLNIRAHSDGSVGVSARCMDYRDVDEYYLDDITPDDGTYQTPDLIRLVQHVRRLEGLE